MIYQQPRHKKPRNPEQNSINIINNPESEPTPILLLPTKQKLLPPNHHPIDRLMIHQNQHIQKRVLRFHQTLNTTNHALEVTVLTHTVTEHLNQINVLQKTIAALTLIASPTTILIIPKKHKMHRYSKPAQPDLLPQQYLIIKPYDRTQHLHHTVTDQPIIITLTKTPPTHTKQPKKLRVIPR